MTFSQRAVVFIWTVCVSITEASDPVQKIATEFWDWRMEDSPVYATSLGRYEFNDRVMSYNMSKFDERKDRVQGFLVQLLKIEINKLSSKQKLNHDILVETLQTYVDGYQWRFHSSLNVINFLDGVHIYPAATIASSVTRGDFENYIVRLQLFPQLVDEIIEGLREARRRNLMNHKVSVDKVPGQIESIIVENVVESEYFAPFNDSLENATNIPATQKEDIRQRAKDAVQGLNGAFTKLKNFLKEEYIPYARSGLGVSSLANGTEYYKACLRWHLSNDMSPEQVHQIGLKEVERIHGEMKKIMHDLSFDGTVRDFFQSLTNNSEFHIDDADRIIEILEDMIHNRISSKLKDYFQNIPDIPVEVQPMDFDGFGGYYSSATETEPGKFNINLFRPRENPIYDLMALTLHEANPGHHLQHIMGMAADLPMYRQQPEYQEQIPFFFPYHTAYVEGWALYSEYLGEEMGIYKDKYEMMGRYGSEMFRACRLVIDTGLHMFNWTREQAIEYMLNYTAYSRTATEIEIDRYVTWPGQACAYKIGELEIKQMRKKAEEKLGTSFNIRDFHTVLLENGAMPLSVMKRVVDEWVAQQQLQTTSGTSAIPVTTAAFMCVYFLLIFTTVN